MKITITAEDILLGQKWHCIKCPIARAVRRAYPERDFAVGVTEVWEHSETIDTVRVPLPANVVKFIDDFDHAKKQEDIPKPFEFDIEIPELED